MRPLHATRYNESLRLVRYYRRSSPSRSSLELRRARRALRKRIQVRKQLIKREAVDSDVLTVSRGRIVANVVEHQLREFHQKIAAPGLGIIDVENRSYNDEWIRRLGELF